MSAFPPPDEDAQHQAREVASWPTVRCTDWSHGGIVYRGHSDGQVERGMVKVYLLPDELSDEALAAIRQRFSSSQLLGFQYILMLVPLDDVDAT